MSAHPSFYALERRRLGGGTDPGIDAHLAKCARCRAHVDGLDQVPAVPAWLEQAPVEPRQRWAVLRPRMWAVLSLAGAAAIALLVLRPRPSLDGDGSRAKGDPVITVHLKRGEIVSRWDGRTPLRAGDRLRLQIDGSRFRFVSVAALAPGAVPQVLYAGALESRGTTLLPLSFRVEGVGDREVIDLVLAPTPPGAELHARPETPTGIWRQKLVLPREKNP